MALDHRPREEAESSNRLRQVSWTELIHVQLVVITKSGGISTGNDGDSQYIRLSDRIGANITQINSNGKPNASTSATFPMDGQVGKS